MAGNEAFETIWDSVWFSLITLSTVGYGDLYPTTWAGRIASLFFVFASVGLLAFIYSQIINSFNKFAMKRKSGEFGTLFKNHTIILGWDHHFAQSVTKKLIKNKQKVAVIVNDQEEIDLIYQEFNKKDIFVLYSEYDNYKRFDLANPNQAKIIFVNLSNDTDKLVACINLKKIFPSLKLTVIVENISLLESFNNVGIQSVLAKNDIISNILINSIIQPK